MDRKSHMVSQKQIAQRLKLSTATVSKSFRYHPDIRAETRAAVFEAAARLGYRKNFSTSNVVARQKKEAKADLRFIGILFNDYQGAKGHDQARTQYLAGLSDAAVSRNVSLIIHRCEDPKSLDVVMQMPALRDGILEGLVLIHSIEPDVVRALSTRLPCVTLTHLVSGARTDHVDCDYMSSIAKLMDHLHALGHRRIGFVGRFQKMAYSRARFAAYIQSQARLSLPTSLDWAVNVFNERDLDWNAQADFIVDRQRKQGVTAWVCASDFVAHHVYPRLIARGIRIPQEMSITGFDAWNPVGIDPTESYPKLTTARVPFAEMGAMALVRLLERIDRPSQPPLQILLGCEVIEGETSGPAPIESHS